MEEERVFSNSNSGMQFDEDADELRMGDSIFGEPDGDIDDFHIDMDCDENMHTTQPNSNPSNSGQSTSVHVPNPTLTRAANPEVLSRLLEAIKAFSIPSFGGNMSDYARGLVKNKKRVHEIYQVLWSSNVYLPDLRSKRVTYKFLLGIIENRYLGVSRSSVINEPCPFIVKAPTKVLIYEIGKIAQLMGFGTGYDLSRPFSRDYYVQVLYKLDPKNGVFPQVRMPLVEPDGGIPGQPLDLTSAVDQMVDGVPLPENFRGLIKINRDRLKTVFYGGLFGGELGVEKIHRMLATASYNIAQLRRTMVCIKKDIRQLSGALAADDNLEVIMNLLIPQ